MTESAWFVVGFLTATGMAAATVAAFVAVALREVPSERDD